MTRLAPLTMRPSSAATLPVDAAAAVAQSRPAPLPSRPRTRPFARAAARRRRSMVAALRRDDADGERDELNRRPAGHDFAFGDGGGGAASTSSPMSMDNWPSLDLASVAAALARSEQAKRSTSGSPSSNPPSLLPGGVHLVGTGPGDAGLLTLRAVALLASADVVLYDRLVSPEILALVNPSARMVYVGKSKGLHTRSQEEIHDLLVAFASPSTADEEEEAEEENDDDGNAAADGKGKGKGKRRGEKRKHPIVLRLKGGDPLVFGRGGEEATALREAGIPVHTVPGISAAGGVAASLGIPLTHRGVATSVRLLTGHARSGGEEELRRDVERVASSGDPDARNTTLVIYMGLSTLPETSRSLIGAGMDPRTPAAAVERGTTPMQRAVYATVADLPSRVEEAELVSPTLIIIGGVVALSPGWQEEFGGGGAQGSEERRGEEKKDDDGGGDKGDKSPRAISPASSSSSSSSDLASAAA